MINGILDQIQVDLNDTVVNIKQINAGYVNDVFLICTLHNKYILKYFRFYDKEKIDLSISLQKYLSTKKLAPEVISEGAYGTYYIVQRYIDTEVLEKDWFLFGKTLGLIHYNFSLCDVSGIKDFSFQDYSTIHCDKVWPKEFDELILLKNRIKNKIHIPEIEHKQLIHGDYTWNNILKEDDKYKVIDFDETKMYFAIYDVAKVVFDLIFSATNTWEDIKNFMNGYQSVCPLRLYEKKEFLNVYAYTLMKDCSGLESKPNKDIHYITKRIEKHKNVLKCFDEYYEITRRLEW
ncbi:MAG: phosphotransferase [Clostridiales bacterium]|jgi:fructosamine-3-kinase|nr:phosphotransferase [Clostridiales bacterium]